MEILVPKCCWSLYRCVRNCILSFAFELNFFADMSIGYIFWIYFVVIFSRFFYPNVVKMLLSINQNVNEIKKWQKGGTDGGMYFGICFLVTLLGCSRDALVVLVYFELSRI